SETKHSVGTTTPTHKNLMATVMADITHTKKLRTLLPMPRNVSLPSFQKSKCQDIRKPLFRPILSWAVPENQWQLQQNGVFLKKYIAQKKKLSRFLKMCLMKSLNCFRANTSILVVTKRQKHIGKTVLCANKISRI